MAEVNITINGRIYEIGCDHGQEGRVVDMAAYVDQKLQQIARAGAAYNDAHLLVLTALVLADELFELRENAGETKPSTKRGALSAAAEGGLSREDEAALAKVLEGLAKRIDGIATKVAAA